MTELDYENALSSIDFTPVDAQPSQKPDWWSDDKVRGTWQDT
ncbi:hypothetical protein [Rugamonas sp. DEMB1]|nr:hypothetical protein [Rugamonas sp. DEMB1]WGG51341.1 hypothetical protein QC826_03465 [Rugamonas sp. DEMB1]